MRLAWVLGCVCALAACGGTGGSAHETTAPEPCTATCDRSVSLRAPFAAVAVDQNRVAIVAASPREELLLGVAEVREGRWLAESLVFRSVSAERVTSLAALADGDALLLAAGGGDGLRLLRVPTEVGLAVESARPSEEPVTSVSLARDDAGAVLCGWASANGNPHLGRFAEGVFEPIDLAAADHGGLVAVGAVGPLPVLVWASQGGLSVLSRDGARTYDARPVRALAVHGDGRRLAIGYTTDAGVSLLVLEAEGTAAEPTAVDDGTRAGQPVHRVGAAISTLLWDSRVLVAYQDQTTGALVTAEVGRMVTRQEHRDPRWTRAMRTSLVVVGGTPFAIDLGGRGDRDLRLAPLVTPLR